MRTYVRTRVKGGTYFFTVNLAERHGNTLLVDHIDALKDAFRRTRQDHPFVMLALWCYRNIFIVFGDCHRAMTISRTAGA